MKKKTDISLVLSGEAGKGLNTIELVLIRALKLSGFHVFSAKEVMSRVRGGNNTVEIRVGSKPVKAFVDRIDILLPLNEGAIDRLEHRLGEDTVIIGLAENVDEKYRSAHRFIEAPFVAMAEEIGAPIYANSVAAGVVAGILGGSPEILGHRMRLMFEDKGEEIVAANMKAVASGHAFGKAMAEKEAFPFDLVPDDKVKNDIVLSGGEAVSLGAIAGGCSFISSYPMSPSTSVLTFLARNAERFGIVAEQAEDEISAINMALGSWYAGARGMVTTSGGGFALMTEGLSLAGMIESPVVIHLAQRPGPATGLPTRTEQGDLLFALYGGHGYFPRIILAPGTIEEAYDLSRRAFGLADTLQVPVIILTDQYLIDSYTNVAGLDTSPVAGGAIVETKKDYSRYRITPDGISPRGVPGHGSGLVCVDSDEHDEDGRITESREVRTAMVEKRLRKSVKVREAAIEPVLTGGEDFRDLVVGWGSTCPIIRGGLDAAGVKDASFLHISQVYPMHPRVREYMEKAERVIVVENNVISQLGKVLLLETGLKPDAVILKYDGHPFSVEELAGRLSEVLQN